MSDALTLADRPDPRRLESRRYPLHVPLRLRLADIDVFGHVNNVALQGLHQEARAAMLDRIWVPERGRRPVQTIAVQHVTHFVGEAFYPGEVSCCGAVGRVGRTSFVLVTLIADADGRAVSTGDTVMVLRADGELLAAQRWSDQLAELAFDTSEPLTPA